jgi:glucose dehydrogenase/plastocyanin
MNLRNPIAQALLAFAATAAPTATWAADSCCTPAGTDWPYTTGSLGGAGYTSLTQIRQSNIKSLGPAWVTHVSAEPVTTPVAGPGNTATAQQTIPIVVDGVMYLDTPSGGVIALNGATGAVKWKWQPSVAANGFGGNSQHRGVTVGDGKVFTTAAGSRVVALNKETGALVWVVQPTAPDGTTLGTIAKVRTTYHDGLVYQGTNDSARGSVFALRASDGALVWHFFSTYPHGTTFTDVNGKTFDAGDTWTTKDAPNDTPNNCYLTGGATAWQHPTIDPELGLLYQAFGNVRSCASSQNGSGRPGDNLFGSSVVALDLKTGAYKWHFQAVRHDIWDMDNALPPALADVTIHGQPRKVLFYGSKSGFQFTLDRTNGKPALPIEDRAVPGDVRNIPARTQPFPLQSIFMAQCVALQNLNSEVPGLQHRMVPNWNGYQAEPDPEHPGQLKLVLRTPNYLTPEEPFMIGPPRLGCMYDGSFDGFVEMSTTGQNGGNDMTNTSYSPRLDLRYIGVSFSPVGHPLQQGGNGLRQIGGYQTGALVAVNNSTGAVAWTKPLKFDLSRQHNPLVTATDLLFHTQMDGWLVGRDAATGDELWRFQMGAPSQAGTISYEINGEQYIATTNMAGSQPYAQGGNGDAVWAFKIGGKAIYHTGPRSDPIYVSGSSEAPNPLPIANWRRPVDNTPDDGVPPNTVYMARSNGTATATKDSTATSSMVPSRLTVLAGTTVTFTNPSDAAFNVPGSGNLKEHCATQFFEGKFNFRLQPGQSAHYTFDREGEYFYNDCTDPRPVGKVIVTLTPQDMPGALRFEPAVLNMKGADGRFTGVEGHVTAMFDVPEGYELDGEVQLQTPLTAELFPAVTAKMAHNKLIATFDKALIDNNIPAGNAVPLTVTANFIHSGVQTKLSSTANVRVMK